MCTICRGIFFCSDCVLTCRPVPVYNGSKVLGIYLAYLYYVDMKIILYCIPRIIWCGAFLGVLVAIGVQDLRNRVIPNLYLIPLLILGVLSLLVFRETSIVSRLIGAVLVSGILFVALQLLPGSVGGGDIKLMAVCGFILGWRALLVVFAIGILAAGGYCLYLLFVRKVDVKSQIALGPFLCGSMALLSLWRMAGSILSLVILGRLWSLY